MIILGIDPGLNGAACLYDTSHPRDLVAVDDLPTTGEGSAREIDALGLFRWCLHRDRQPQHAFIENVFAFPILAEEGQPAQRMGQVMAFRFGIGIGAIRAVVRITECPVTLVVPRTWKKTFGLKGSDKEQSRAMALRLFPDAADHFTRKKDHQKAESALIAKHGAKWLGVEL